uniref:Uncharacterized protein n=1 Tax=Octopus bimaculoides TaxID=37653 RepID=A0A0L8HZC1_OCTBM
MFVLLYLLDPYSICCPPETRFFYKDTEWFCKVIFSRRRMTFFILDCYFSQHILCKTFLLKMESKIEKKKDEKKSC